MLLKQIKYFQAVVETHSFSEAGERCHISQSAISQQIKALESDLGVELLKRHNRTFSLTEAGELFYRRSLVITADIQQLRSDVSRIANKENAVLRIGYLKCYGGSEFQDATAAFAEKYPEVKLSVINGNHETLYDALRTEKVDIILNDQRRAFSEDYVNFELVKSHCYIEISKKSPLSKLERIEPSELKNTPCILVTDPEQQENEASYYRDIVGFRGEFCFANSLQDARVLVAAGQGFLPIEGIRNDVYYDSSITRIPLYKQNQPLRRNYCAFWLKENSGYYVEAFAEMLKKEFE